MEIQWPHLQGGGLDGVDGLCFYLLWFSIIFNALDQLFPVVSLTFVSCLEEFYGILERIPVMLYRSCGLVFRLPVLIGWPFLVTDCRFIDSSGDHTFNGYQHSTQEHSVDWCSESISSSNECSSHCLAEAHAREGWIIYMTTFFAIV